MALFAPNRRWLSIASIATILTAGLHTLGQFGPEPPAGSALAAAEAAMQNTRIAMGAGMTPSVWEIFRDLTFTMSVTVFAMGMLGLAVARDREAPARLVRRISVVLALATAALTAISAVYQVFPPLVCFAVVLVLFVMATLKSSAR